MAASRFAIDEEFSLVTGSKDVDGCYLTFTVGPSPVREDVCLRVVGSPAGLVQVEAILLEASKVLNLLVLQIAIREGVKPTDDAEV